MGKALMENFLAFWGKAQPRCAQGPGSHPLAWHSLDVAAVAERLLDLFPAIPAALAAISGMDEEQTRKFLILLAALHDIGKLAPGFQAKSEEHYPRLVLGPPPESQLSGDHPAIGLRLLTRSLAKDIDVLMPSVTEYARNALFSAITGHHGRPVEADNRYDSLSSPVEEAARAFLAAIVDLLGIDRFSAGIKDKRAKLFSWGLAGLVTLADWLGSDQSVFLYEEPHLAIRDYWIEIARPRADQVIRRAGIAGSPIAPTSGFAALTGRAAPPSPLQAYVESVPLSPQGPGLFMIEDVTGAGKTEAYLILAHRMMRAGWADGIFVALPTMATANAMFNRLSSIYRRLFAPESDPSLALAHGAADLHEGFRRSILEGVGASERGYGAGRDDDEISASAACAAWIAQDRRRVFLADVGVGTIDQAFLGVLPSKFAALRLLGLSRRILIVDEAHSYGAFEGQELAALLEFHAALGGSAIVASATLPCVVKDRLAEAFNRGLGLPKPQITWPSKYPLFTQIDSAGTAGFHEKLATRPELVRAVEVERLADESAAIEAIVAAVARGAAVAWVRNTVDDVQTGAAALKALGYDPIIFHARFAMLHRQAIEGRIVTEFGAASGPETREGKIVVASQVIEQSLDLDFDLIVSDLAPVDLLIQRAGRLWRHRRESRPLSAPKLLVVSPEPVEDAGPDWLRRAMPGTALVYRNHALMWRTAKVLFAAGHILSPDGIRPLVEAVYAAEALDKVPKGLEGIRTVAEGEEAAKRSVGTLSVLKLSFGYLYESLWGEETRVVTRLGAERTIFRLMVWDGGALTFLPGIPAGDERRAWALSSVALTKWRAEKRGRYPDEIERAARALEGKWEKRGEDSEILPIIEEGGGFTAYVFSCRKECSIKTFYKDSGGLYYL